MYIYMCVCVYVCVCVCVDWKSRNMTALSREVVGMDVYIFSC